MTPTLKLKRYKIIKKYKTEIEKLFDFTFKADD